MLTIKHTDRFQHWYLQLADGVARQRIHAQITQTRHRNVIDWRSLGDGVFELRCGPAHRVYLSRPVEETVVLLLGGDKATHTRDIFFAKRLAKSIRRTYED